MELAVLTPAGPLLHGRGEQRVRHPDAVAVNEHQAALDRVVQHGGLGDPGEL